jgi:hypothetical protein
VSTLPVPFRQVDAEPRGFLRRLFRGADYEAAARAIGNLYAHKPPESVTSGEIEMTLQEFGVRHSHIDDVLDHVYLQALNEFLRDNALSPEETDYLKRLGASLGRTDVQREAALISLAEPIFKNAVEEAVRDNVISDKDAELLSQVGAQLSLSQVQQDRIRGGVVGSIIQKAFNAAIADRRYTEDEERSILQLCKQLRVSPTFTNTENIDRFRMLARVEAGQYPTIEAPVALQKNEQCHFVSSARWAEIRTVTKRVSYSGITTSIRIMKGVRYRTGSVTPHRITQDVLSQLDAGEFLLTSKRVIFRGTRSNKVIPYSGILGFEVYADGIKLEKSSGKPPYLLFSGDIELAATILSARLAQA